VLGLILKGYKILPSTIVRLRNPTTVFLNNIKSSTKSEWKLSSRQFLGSRV
jgi:hypothetical protein